MWCKARVSKRVGSEKMTYLVARHGLLHCIGLAHDDNPASAIHPFPNAYDDGGADRMAAARITDHDKALLLRMYKRGE